jgi:dTDP-4-dehydrorhamnose reductase
VSWRRILLTGAAGQIGHDLARRLPALAEVVAVDRGALDLADRDAVVRAVRDVRPDLIVNAGAYTAVDRAESEPGLARAVNAVAPGLLAEEAKRIGAVLVHYSTDYVFDGTGSAPYREDTPTAPINAYGRSKLEGEQAVAAAGGAWVILRTSWVYATRGRNFLLTMRRLAAEREELRVVDDQLGTPNWSAALAEATLALVDRPAAELAQRTGIYHLTCTGKTSWFGFARAIFAGASRPRLVPITSDEYPTPARRPRYSVLDGSRLASAFGVALPPWTEALGRCLAEEAAAAADTR